MRIDHQIGLVERAMVGCTLDYRVAIAQLLSDVVRRACAHLSHAQRGDLG